MAIDYVVPMVFPQDLKWRHDYITANGMFRDDKQSIKNTRYRTWGTEELLIRLIRKNLPWIRTIHILLARPSQVEYLSGLNNLSNQSNPNVHFVFHKDFMPKEVLPTFNSRAIEMYLHRIPGLAPYFLYGNDDMFPMAPMVVEDFFRRKGDNGGSNNDITENRYNDNETASLWPCLHYTRKTFNPSSAFHQACMNGLNFVADNFKQHFEGYWLHIGHNVVPIVKGTCEMFWRQCPKKMQGSVTRYRLAQNYNQYIYSWWQILSGQYVDYKPTRGYVSTSNSINEIINAIRTTDGLLCINDNDAVNDITNLAAIVRSEMQKRL